MPPNAAIWYSDNDRATTQRGVNSCTVTLNVDNASTHAAPPNASAAIVSSSCALMAAIAAATAKAMQAQRTRPSVDSTSRKYALPIAPPIAPTPNAPSSRP